MAQPSSSRNGEADAASQQAQPHQPDLDVQTRAAAGGHDQATPTNNDPVQFTRTFGWQEKVYSKAELVAAQVWPTM